jgi:hypothetical protein
MQPDATILENATGDERWQTNAAMQYPPGSPQFDTIRHNSTLFEVVATACELYSLPFTLHSFPLFRLPASSRFLLPEN